MGFDSVCVFRIKVIVSRFSLKKVTMVMVIASPVAKVVSVVFHTCTATIMITVLTRLKNVKTRVIVNRTEFRIGALTETPLC